MTDCPRVSTPPRQTRNITRITLKTPPRQPPLPTRRRRDSNGLEADSSRPRLIRVTHLRLSRLSSNGFAGEKGRCFDTWINCVCVCACVCVRVRVYGCVGARPAYICTRVLYACLRVCRGLVSRGRQKKSKAADNPSDPGSKPAPVILQHDNSV